jgi:hypothetical protein
MRDGRRCAPARFAAQAGPWPAPASDKYRTLFRRVGEPWLWFSRLVIPDDALRRDPR